MSGIDKLKSVDWRGLVKTATNKVKQYTLNLSPLEIKVEDATNMETWGPHGSAMNEIAEACYDPEGYRQVIGVIARRLQERDEHWRMCYKALLLLEHLIKHGPMKIAQDVASSMAVMERLQSFQYKDANSHDHGVNVRHRAKEIVDLITRPDRLREEREKAKANRDKYRGVSATEMRMGGHGNFVSGGSSSSSSRFDPASLQRPGGSGSQPSAQRPGGGYPSYNSDTSYNSSSSYEDRRPAATASNYTNGGDIYSGGSGRHAVGGNNTSGSPGHFGGAADAAAPSQDPDVVSATQARIEKLRLSERAAAAAAEREREAAAAERKKKLTDVKVNPKIAASLGLKVTALPPPSSKTTSTSHVQQQQPQAVVNDDLDLLGGLMDDDDNNNTAATAAANDGGWDAFGGDSFASGGASEQQQAEPLAAAAAAPPANTARPPLDDFFSDITAPPPSTTAAFDPFATFDAHPPPAAAVSTAPKPTVALSLPNKAKSPNSGSKAAANKEEDAFASLTGIHATAAGPMGKKSGLKMQAQPLDDFVGGGSSASSPPAPAPMFVAFDAPAPAVAHASAVPASDPFDDLLQ